MLGTVRWATWNRPPANWARFSSRSSPTTRAGRWPTTSARRSRASSGLVACGRSPLYTIALKRAFAARLVDKSYLALVEGDLLGDTFDVELPLRVAGSEARIKVKMLVLFSGAPLVTSCAVVARY